MSVSAGNFLISIDTERDNAWSRLSTPTTNNADYLPRFNDLCARFSLIPTYLTNYEMCLSQPFVRFARAALAKGRCEIGMHLHAWDSPPLGNPELDGADKSSYLIEYSAREMSLKLRYLKNLLQDTFGQSITSHRAGRWALNAEYVSQLLELGIEVDCSVTPHVDWSGHTGQRIGGTDFRDFPNRPYFMSPSDISKPCDSGLLQLPMTIRRDLWPLINQATANFRADQLLPRVLNRFFPRITWLRPNGRNLRAMMRLLNTECNDHAPYVMLMLHSSELMPGGSPTFPTTGSIERLYRDLEKLFQAASQSWVGSSISAFASDYKKKYAIASKMREW